VSCSLLAARVKMEVRSKSPEVGKQVEVECYMFDVRRETDL
jgi:hypothetical protein